MSIWKNQSKIKPGNQLLQIREVRPGVVKERRGTPLLNYSEIRSAIWKTATTDVNGIKKLNPYKVQVQAILEPLKVRMISKGETLPYWVSRVFQKKLWKHMNKFPQFALTGRPMDASDLYDILEKEKELELDTSNYCWVSGDYSAATDNIESAFTKLAFETALLHSGLNFKDQEILRGVIYEQELHYPSVKQPGGGFYPPIDPVMQTQGQLMGSTLSFPILCIINLLAYSRAMKRRYPELYFSLKDLPVKINGDDILFRADTELYDIWQEEVKKVGFSLSLGKNYIHPSLLTVNSELYCYRPNSLNSVLFEKIEFFNVGLLTVNLK
jgi:hypothetical protein